MGADVHIVDEGFNSYTASEQRGEVANVKHAEVDPGNVVLAGRRMSEVTSLQELTEVHGKVAEGAGVAASANMALIANRLTGNVEHKTALEAIRGTTGASAAAVAEELARAGEAAVEASPDASLSDGREEIVAKIRVDAFNKAAGIAAQIEAQSNEAATAVDQAPQDQDLANANGIAEGIPLEGLEQSKIELADAAEVDAAVAQHSQDVTSDNWDDFIAQTAERAGIGKSQAIGVENASALEQREGMQAALHGTMHAAGIAQDQEFENRLAQQMLALGTELGVELAHRGITNESAAERREEERKKREEGAALVARVARREAAEEERLRVLAERQRVDLEAMREERVKDVANLAKNAEREPELALVN